MNNFQDGYSPLAHPNWLFVEKQSIEDFTAADWQTLEVQRHEYISQVKAQHMLRLLKVSAEDASFGYRVNMYRHALQSATMALRDGLSNEDVVVALFHDVGSGLIKSCISSRMHMVYPWANCIDTAFKYPFD